MKSALVIDGCVYELKPLQARAAMKAALNMRSGYVRENRDRAAYQLYVNGCSYESIGKVLGLTVKGVKAALTRVESGRYGTKWSELSSQR